MALEQHLLELIGIRVPGGTPTLGHHLFATNINLDVPGIVEDKIERRGGFRFDEALIDHRSAVEVEALGQVLDATALRLLCQF